ncbi:MAG TPA: bifunctional precorrin-2 dehydrogenase/sirohydrochlorin ferrochelatase [Acidimicrobiia bacterium]|nr:bifunctional precorrin-2 dehydrogenase/sirohydrochlorin ferrochelatase [Acidimicrobiia bacterium]
MTTTRRSLLGYPVNLVVAGRRCVVVGAGRIAARKVDGLLAAGAEVHVVAPRLGDRVRAWRDEGRITVAERAFLPGDLDGAWLATAATDDHAVNHAVYEAGDARGVWVNSADDPDNCSFTLMSVIRRGDLVVTVGTGGRSPALATWLKERITAELGPEYETLVELLSDARDAMQADGRSTEEADWKRALDSGMLDLIRAGRVDDAKELLRSCLSSSSV